MKIGILEDDPDQAALMILWLQQSSHEVYAFNNGEAFIESVTSEPYDMLMLDWELPDTTGPEVLKIIRSKLDWSIPVLFATQRDSEGDIVGALESGADDYMVKPVKRFELIARSQALGRRAGVLEGEGNILEFGPISLDKSNSIAQVSGESIKLTQKEFEVIAYLAQNIGRLVSRDHLLEVIWGKGQDIQTRTVDMHISRVRKKLNINPSMGYRIKTIYQHGYRLEILNEAVINE